MPMTDRGRIVHEGRLRYYAYAEFVLLAVTSAAAYKIARITFGKDGSIYVQFPYCIERDGWIGVLPIDPNHEGPITHSMAHHGSYVGTDVKFAHHTSGEAHFSKTGDETIPRTARASWPLTGPLGHLFDLQVMQPEQFTRLEKRDKRVMYLGVVAEPGSEAIAWHAEWRRKRDIESNIRPRGGIAGPTTKVLSRATGRESEVFFLGQPQGYGARDHIVMLTAGRSERPQGFVGSGMTFLAGWDTHEVARAGEKADVRGCLAFVYPARPPALNAAVGLGGRLYRMITGALRRRWPR